MKKVVFLSVLLVALGLAAQMKAYCARHGITYLDYASAMVGPDGRKIRDGLSGDTVHPNAEGYAMMEALLLDALR